MHCLKYFTVLLFYCMKAIIFFILISLKCYGISINV